MGSSVDTLRAYLDHPDRDDESPSFTELQGFLFAIANAPELVMPSEWLPVVLGTTPVLANSGNAREIESALIDRGAHREVRDWTVGLTSSMPTPDATGTVPLLPGIENLLDGARRKQSNANEQLGAHGRAPER